MSRKAEFGKAGVRQLESFHHEVQSIEVTENFVVVEHLKRERNRRKSQEARVSILSLSSIRVILLGG
jgi:hypothetical protein